MLQIKKNMFLRGLVFYIILFFSWTQLSAQTMTVRQYIDTFKNTAMIEMIEHKVPASITLAQGILESGAGNSKLSKQGNNHFGIKCKKEWTGCTILEDDDALQECFRCYKTPQESYKDHSLFLVNGKRYAFLFELDITDYKAWANGLLSAGYATNQKYAELLIKTIERNRLTQFDSLIKNGFNPYGNFMPPNIEIVENKVPYQVVQPNQTIQTIAKETNKTEKKIIKYNDLKNKTIAPGDVLYLKPKKRKASIESYVVKEGDNMWLISQKYAVKLNVLYKKNNMQENTEPLPGQIINLRKKSSTTPDTGRVEMSQNTNYHYVKQGETLYSISKLYNISVEDIKRINQLNSNSLLLGQKLLVKNEVLLNEADTYLEHVVSIGDTFYNISKKYNVSVEDLKKWNNLNSSTLNIGQKLKIKK